MSEPFSTPITTEQLSAVLQSVSDNTRSELIRFFIIFAVICLAVISAIIWLYPKWQKGTAAQRAADNKADSQRLDQYIKREALIIEVVRQNTEVMTGLKTVLDVNTRRVDAMADKLDQNTLLMTQLLAQSDNRPHTPVQ